MYFQWKEKYLLGIEEVDRQHKKLFSIGERLSNLIQTADIWANFTEINQIVEELKDYTLYHFSLEEKFMEQYEYPDLTSHAMVHEFLRKKLLKIEYKKEPNYEVVVQLVSFISDWVSEHILISDMKIRNYLLSKEEVVR